MAGENPMRWDCAASGCFNKVKRPKIEQFAEAFHGRIAMSDVDGLVEINGYFLFLEWKPSADPLRDGQRILYEQLTRLSDRVRVVVVAGNAETMQVSAVKVFRDGKGGDWVKADKGTLIKYMARWASCAKNREFPAPKQEAGK